MKIEDPIVGNIDWSVADEEYMDYTNCTNQFCKDFHNELFKTTTVDSITLDQNKYLKEHKWEIMQKIYLADFHQMLREAGCDWI